MLTPILVGAYGETLIDTHGARRDEYDKLYSCIGLHDLCNSFVDLNIVSEQYQAIRCRGCGFRLVIPRSVGTYSGLRAWCAGHVKPER